MLIQARVIFPWGPTASANAVMGIRHRCSGLRNHGSNMPRADRSLSSRVLLTGLGLFGLPVRCFTECLGKPLVIASKTDRNSVVSGKIVSGRVDTGGNRLN